MHAYSYYMSLVHTRTVQGIPRTEKINLLLVAKFNIRRLFVWDGE